MNKKLKRVMFLLLGLFVIGLATPAIAQDINEAKRAIKKGDQDKRADNYEEAITSFNKCIDITSQLADNEEAKELKEAAEKKVTKSHLDYANDLLEQNKYDQALKHYNKTIELGKKYGQSEYQKKAETNVSKVYYAQGKNHFSESKYEEAISLFEKAIEGDPNYGWAYIRKALAYRQLGDVEKMEKAVQEAVEIGQNAGEDGVVSSAREVAYKYFYNNGAKALKAKNYAEAIPNLEKAIQYNGNTTLYHYLAICYSQESKYEEAVENEKKVIESFKGEKSKDEMAQYYYTLGNYYENMGQTTDACEAYKNASFGKYKENAEYKIEHVLNCN